MTGRSLTAVATLVFLAAAGVGAVDKWDKRPFNTWTDLDLKDVLTNSPWAGKGNVSYIRTNGANAQPIEEIALVSWASSLPLREAGVREQIKLGAPIPSEVDAALAKPVEMYIITVKITGGTGPGYASSAAAMQAETSLVRNGKPPIQAARVEGRTLDKSGKPVETPAGPGFGPGRGRGAPGGGFGPPPGGGFGPPAGGPPAAPPSQSLQQSATGQVQVIDGTYAPASGRAQAPALAAQGGGGGFGGGGFGGGGGGGGSALLIYAFPKTDPITLADKEVELVSKLCGGRGFGGGFGGGGAQAGGGAGSNCSHNLKKKFKLKDMTYKGELAL